MRYLKEMATKRRIGAFGGVWSVILLVAVLLLDSANPTIAITPTPRPGTTPFGGTGSIAFIRKSQLYVMNSGGSNPRCLTCSLGLVYITAPSWSPPGKRIEQ